jgi:hypothetical protein
MTGGGAAHRSFRTASVDSLLIDGHRRAAGLFVPLLYADNPQKTQALRRQNLEL